MIPLLGVALLVAVSGGCRAGSSGQLMGRTAPTTFESARSGPHRVGHAPGTCDLCDLYYKARAHVVRVRTQTGIGAGIVVSSSGRILTNAHVAGEDVAPVAETYGGDSLDSRVLRSDAGLDLAVLQAVESAVHWEPISVEPGELPEVGSDVYVIGHPVGLGWTVTRGVVSATRKVGEVGPTPVIQTDAAISPGNSGGPLLDRDGRLLGVVSSKFAGPGIESVGFAIPASVAADFLGDVANPKP
jgi:serine protease Do